MTKFLFVTDLDYTLVGDDIALEKLNRWLNDHRQTYGTTIAYATGRPLSLYQQLMKEKDLLKPDVLMACVGTEIYEPESDAPNQDWTSKIARGWEREQIIETAKKNSCLTPLSAIEQTPYKVSYRINSDKPYQIISWLKTALDSQGLMVEIVDWDAGNHIDILPQYANKGSALAFVRQRLGFRDEQIVFCGDSGNDIAMFQTVPGYGIIVGNAMPELLEWHQRSHPGKRYMAKKHFAAGILEGLEHFGFLT